MAEKDIPKKIHYCWFGGKPLDSLGMKCKESWQKFFPGYEIIEWNENNFDITSCQYVKEAYQVKKWAFVSDYARFKILYEYGGLYFDTDVEVIKDMSPILTQGPFMGVEAFREEKNKDWSIGKIAVAPGLGLAVTSGHDLYKEIIEHYEQSRFIRPDGELDLTTVVERTTEILLRHGLENVRGIQKIDGINIYPPEYFCPMDWNTGRQIIGENTYSVHHYAGSWTTKANKRNTIIYRRINKMLGNELVDSIWKIIKRLKKNE